MKIVFLLALSFISILTAQAGDSATELQAQIDRKQAQLEKLKSLAEAFESMKQLGAASDSIIQDIQRRNEYEEFGRKLESQFISQPKFDGLTIQQKFSQYLNLNNVGPVLSLENISEKFIGASNTHYRFQSSKGSSVHCEIVIPGNEDTSYIASVQCPSIQLFLRRTPSYKVFNSNNYEIVVVD